MIINSYTPINVNQEFSNKYVYRDYRPYDDALYIRGNNRYSAYNWRNMEYPFYIYNTIYSLTSDNMQSVGILPLCMRRF